jgi:two-component system NtrC family sensor kinase
MLGLTLTVGVLDLMFWLYRGVTEHVQQPNIAATFTRISLICIVSGVAIYFYKMSSRLMALNRTLIRDLDSHTRLLTEKNSQLYRLRNLSEALISQVDLGSALNLALEMATDVIGARTASIMLFDPQTEELTIAAARGLPKKVIKNTRTKIGEGLAGFVAQKGEAIVVNSDELDERFVLLAHRTQEIKSAIIAPIKIDGHVRGVINVSDKLGPDKWCDEDLGVVAALAGQAAMAIQKIELYESLQEQVAMLRDALQELQKTQAGLIQSEKLASIGQIAGGVAHEINNPLMVILGRTEFAIEKLKSDDPAAKDLDVIRSQTERIAEIVRNLLNFARANRADDLKPVAINEIIERTLALTELQMAKHNIIVKRELRDDLPQVWGNPGQLQQVLVNIVINAYQAMSKIGGSLTVSTLEKNGKLVVSFSDTGPGITKEDREKIFEPFFTTKNETEGTGLGLAISRGIIHTHGGKIEADGEPGKGAVFTVELPIMDAGKFSKEEEKDEREVHNGCRRRARDSRAVS